MGGMISTRFVQTQDADLAAFVIPGPVIRGKREIIGLAEMDPIPEGPPDPTVLSRNPAVGEAYSVDPLVYHGPFAKGPC